MNANAGQETLKTLLFVGVAVATLLVAFFSRPSKEGAKMDDEEGKVMFTSLSDPGAANGIEVLSFDEDLGDMSRFKVAQQDQGLFVIPSHQNYPADAQERLVNAVTMFVDLEAIRVVSELDSEHEAFGVVEPSLTDTRVGDAGVGMLVTVFGKSEEGHAKLAELIIGKPVKGLDGQHYVRRPGKSRVYQVRIDPSQLSTRFADWIETDLLQLSTWDISGLTLKDYSVQAQGFNITGYDQRLELKVTNDGGNWSLDLLKEFIDGDLRPSTMEQGEELNKERLDTLINALGELKIVNVERKPRGLGADLKADKEFLADMDSNASLAEKGFYAVKFQDGSMELLSSDGELIVDMKDGVRYLLRFGQIAGIGENASTSDDGEESTEASVNRYMFVSVQLNEGQFPEPDLEALPDGGENVDLTQAADGKLDNELALEVERITKANQRKIDARNDSIEAAKTKVSELSYRFADWYYVVSDDVFRKLRLRRNDAITFSEEALKSGTTIHAFRDLQQRGLVPTTP